VIRSATWALQFVVGLLSFAEAQDARNGPAFEVASLKPSTSVNRGYSLTLYPGGRVRGVNISLQQLIQIAYDLKLKNQVTGAFSWLDSQRYNLEASAGSAVGEPQVRLMIQALLEERFKLKFHREIRELPVYSLVLAKNGVKRGTSLRAAPSGDCGAMTTPQAVPPPAGPGAPDSPCGGISLNFGKLTGHRTNMGELATNLSTVLGSPVLDKTGIEGSFDLTLTWTPDQLAPGQPPPDVSAPSIYTALQEQLGLKVEAGKGPVEIIVVDSAEKASEN
jgi:uncharacterized protein (TIGR03435 family)